MISVVLPTFRRSAFRRPPRSLQAPWGPGMPGTHYVLRGDNYDLRVQDASPATTGRASLKRPRRQRGGIYPGARANNSPPSRIAEMHREIRARYARRANNPPLSRIAQMQRAIRTRHPTNPQRRRQRAASRALANRPSERVARSVNRALWSVRRKLTPTTLTGKLSAAAALRGAAAAAPMALLGTLLTSAIKKDKG